MFGDLEFFFSISCLGLAEHLLGLLLLPLKLLLPWQRRELRDIVTFLLMAACIGGFCIANGVTTQLYSYVYHGVRRTSFLKLVMIFGMLDMLDKLLSSFCQDSAEVLYTCVEERCSRRPASRQPYQEDGRLSAVKSSPSTLSTSWWLLLGSGVVAALSMLLHSFTLLLHVVTLNVAINAEGNSLLPLVVGNNFTELKSFVFKKYTPEALLSICGLDAIERLQYVVFFFVMLLHHLHERVSDFALGDVLVILLVEVAIDFVKHLFVARFNGIAPSVFRSYSQLAMIDISAEKVLWQLPNLTVVLPDQFSAASSGAHSSMIGGSDGRDVAQLLEPSHGLIPKHVKRSGFNAIAYASLMLWSLSRMMEYLLSHAPVVLILLIGVAVLLKVVLGSIVYGVCTKFILRTVLVEPPTLPTRPGTPTMAKRNSSTAKNGGVAFPIHLGISPISTPRSTPLENISASRCGRGSGTFNQAQTVIQLTPLLLALLKVDRFDLQAGKAKRLG